MSQFLEKSERDAVSSALKGGDGNALREEFCRIGLSSVRQQEIMLKAMNGCAQEEKCRTEEGLTLLELYSNGKLVTDPNETGDTLKWTNDKGQANEFVVKPCDAPTS